MAADLQRELIWLGTVGCVLLLFFAGIFNTLAGEAFALHWLLLGALCWFFVCWQYWRVLALNRRDHDAPLYPDLGHANRLTLLRAFLIACTAGFLANPFDNALLGFVPALFYTIAAICDRVDGYLARRQKRTTLLGTELDTVIDALGLVVAPLLAVLYGKIHVSYLLVSAAYYVFQWGLYWRRQHHQPVYPLLPSRLRRTMAGFQMGVVAGALWPPLAAGMTQLFAFAFMLPLLAGFLVDWLVVSGRLDSSTPHLLQRFDQWAAVTQRWLMPVVRAALVLLLLAYAAPLPALLAASVFGIAFYLCTLAIAVGLLGRACATVLMLLLCWQFPFVAPDGRAIAVIAGVVLVILLGTGRYSLRNADEAWIHRQDGA